MEDTDRLVEPLRLLLTVALCVEVAEIDTLILGVMVELREGELDWVEDRLTLSVPLPLLVPLLQKLELGVLDVDAVTVLLRLMLCVPVLHIEDVEETETVVDPLVDGVPVLQSDSVRVVQELAE